MRSCVNEQRAPSERVHNEKTKLQYVMSFTCVIGDICFRRSSRFKRTITLIALETDIERNKRKDLP